MVSRVESTACAIPKSITLAPVGESSTFAGFRSRCTSPAAWIALSASASSRASRRWFGLGQRPAVAHGVLQRRPVDELGGQPRRVGLRVGVEHPGGEHPGDRGGRGHLPPEPLPEPRLAGQLVPDDLDRGLACRPRTRRGRPGPSRRRPAGPGAGSDRSAPDRRPAGAARPRTLRTAARSGRRGLAVGAPPGAGRGSIAGVGIETLVAGVLIVVGIAGVLIPVLPGLLLVLAGIAVWAVPRNDPVGWTVLGRGRAGRRARQRGEVPAARPAAARGRGADSARWPSAGCSGSSGSS